VTYKQYKASIRVRVRIRVNKMTKLIRKLIPKRGNAYYAYYAYYQL